MPTTIQQNLGGLESASTDLAEMSISSSMDEKVITGGEIVPTSSFASAMATLREGDEEDTALEEGIYPLPASSTMVPKFKIKKRPAVDPMNPPVAAAEEPQKESLPALPEQFRTEEFESFVDGLLSEANDRKLIKLFKKLQTHYGLESETDESKNKGYFAIKCPITNEVRVRTYHHLHDAENRFASIFMAMRDVLKDVGLSL